MKGFNFKEKKKLKLFFVEAFPFFPPKALSVLYVLGIPIALLGSERVLSVLYAFFNSY